MKIIFETTDIANANEKVLMNLLGVMKEIASASEKASEEPAKAEIPVVHVEEKKEAPKQEDKKSQPAPKKEEPKKAETKKEEPKQEPKAAESKPQANPSAPKKEEKPAEPVKDEPKKKEAPTEAADNSGKDSEPPADTEEATPEVSRADVIALGKSLTKNGKVKEVQALMKGTYGASKFSDITDDQLPEVYKAFKEIENG